MSALSPNQSSPSTGPRVRRLFPHAEYAEDQKYSKTILTTHVLHRGAQSGALIGALASTARMAYARNIRLPLRAAGLGAIWGTALSAVAVTGRMWGRSEIEWQDRSWRLLANKGQVEVDNWSIAGTIIGGLLSRRSLVRIVGGAALGNLAGVSGYMIWHSVF